MNRAARESQFIERGIEKYGTKFDYSLVEFKNNHTTVTIICSEHGKFTQQPNNHLTSKEGCYQCGKNRAGRNHRLSQETFIERATIVHGNVYSYNKIEYIGAFIPVVIECPKHGEFTMQPNDHVYHEAGCKHCGYENRLTKGEQKIADFLTASNIPFVVQHTFDDLWALDGTNPLRYDFFLPSKNMLVEFDGPHHYKPTRYRGTTQEQAEHTHNRTITYDKMKNEYATEKGIQMVRIPYRELKNINTLLEQLL